MLPTKIRLTDEIINNIKSARIANRIPAAELSRAIKRDVSYISSLELKRLKTLSAIDLTAIISYMFNLPEYKAVEKVESIIGINKETDTSANHNNDIFHSHNENNINKGNYDNSDNDDSIKNNQQLIVHDSTSNEYWYGDMLACADPELISDMLNEIIGLISVFFKNEPKETVFILNSFIKTFKLDPVFTMKLMGMPFFTLKALSTDIRIKVLNDLSAILKKYADAANPAAIPASGGRLPEGKGE